MTFSEHQFISRDGLSLYYRSYGQSKESRFPAPACGGRRLHSTACNERTTPLVPLASLRSPNRGRRVACGSHAGQGRPAVLCLPGLTRNSKDFHALATHLVNRPGEPWRVICPDLRGRGQSDRDRNYHHYHPATYVRDTWRLLDQAGIDQVIIIGTSLGGVMAMIMAAQQARRLVGVVMNDVGPEVPPEALARIARYAGRVPPVSDWPTAAIQAQAMYGLAYPRMPESFWLDYARLSWRENERGRPEPDVDPGVGLALRRPSLLLKGLQRLHRAGLVRRLGGVNIDPWDSFRAMTMPTLLVHGVLSDVLTDDIVERMQQVKPDLQVVGVPDRGHVPLLDEPVARAAIDAFLEALRPGLG